MANKFHRQGFSSVNKVEEYVKGKPKIKIFFEHFQALPSWFTNLWILVCASIFGIKGTQIFRNGGGKK